MIQWYANSRLAKVGRDEFLPLAPGTADVAKARSARVGGRVE